MEDRDIHGSGKMQNLMEGILHIEETGAAPEPIAESKDDAKDGKDSKDGKKKEWVKPWEKKEEDESEDSGDSKDSDGDDSGKKDEDKKDGDKPSGKTKAKAASGGKKKGTPVKESALREFDESGESAGKEHPEDRQAFDTWSLIGPGSFRRHTLTYLVANEIHTEIVESMVPEYLGTEHCIDHIVFEPVSGRGGENHDTIDVYNERAPEGNQFFNYKVRLEMLLGKAKIEKVSDDVWRILDDGDSFTEWACQQASLITDTARAIESGDLTVDEAVKRGQVPIKESAGAKAAGRTKMNEAVDTKEQCINAFLGWLRDRKRTSGELRLKFEAAFRRAAEGDQEPVIIEQANRALGRISTGQADTTLPRDLTADVAGLMARKVDYMVSDSVSLAKIGDWLSRFPDMFLSELARDDGDDGIRHYGSEISWHWRDGGVNESAAGAKPYDPKAARIQEGLAIIRGTGPAPNNSTYRKNLSESADEVEKDYLGKTAANTADGIYDRVKATFSGKTAARVTKIIAKLAEAKSLAEEAKEIEKEYKPKILDFAEETLAGDESLTRIIETESAIVTVTAATENKVNQTPDFQEDKFFEELETLVDAELFPKIVALREKWTSVHERTVVGTRGTVRTPSLKESIMDTARSLAQRAILFSRSLIGWLRDYDRKLENLIIRSNAPGFGAPLNESMSEPEPGHGGGSPITSVEIRWKGGGKAELEVELRCHYSSLEGKERIERALAVLTQWGATPGESRTLCGNDSSGWVDARNVTENSEFMKLMSKGMCQWMMHVTLPDNFTGKTMTKFVKDGEVRDLDGRWKGGWFWVPGDTPYRGRGGRALDESARPAPAGVGGRDHPNHPRCS